MAEEELAVAEEAAHHDRAVSAADVAGVFNFLFVFGLFFEFLQIPFFIFPNTKSGIPPLPVSRQLIVVMLLQQPMWQVISFIHFLHSFPSFKFFFCVVAIPCCFMTHLLVMSHVTYE